MVCLKEYYSAYDCTLYKLYQEGSTRFVAVAASTYPGLDRVYQEIAISSQTVYQPFFLTLADDGVTLIYRDSPFYIKSIYHCDTGIIVTVFGSESTFVFPYKAHIPSLLVEPKPVYTMVGQNFTCLFSTNELLYANMRIRPQQIDNIKYLVCNGESACYKIKGEFVSHCDNYICTKHMIHDKYFYRIWSTDYDQDFWTALSKLPPEISIYLSLERDRVLHISGLNNISDVYLRIHDSTLVDSVVHFTCSTFENPDLVFPVYFSFVSETQGTLLLNNIEQTYDLPSKLEEIL